MFCARLAKSKLTVGSRPRIEQAACTNPLNSPSFNALNARQNVFTKMECVTFQAASQSSVGFAEHAITDSLKNHHKKIKNGQ
jgi:hypothetical protein